MIERTMKLMPLARQTDLVKNVEPETEVHCHSNDNQLTIGGFSILLVDRLGNRNGQDCHHENSHHGESKHLACLNPMNLF